MTETEKLNALCGALMASKEKRLPCTEAALRKLFDEIVKNYEQEQVEKDRLGDDHARRSSFQPSPSPHSSFAGYES
ncbi:hypothetical protein [Dinoroseobacter shibae]|jgi:hypothetical protein|uniref:hypothetical protein n=1 Tax=Dinoroseobacter shibae TaxID=215813 RepID=UPI0030ED298D